MATQTRSLFIGLFWAALAILIWSGSLVMLRIGVTTSLNAYDLTFLRFGVSAVILAPFLAVKGRGSTRLTLRGVAIMIVTFGAPYGLLISFALMSVPAAAAGALNPGVMAIAAVLLGRLVLGDALSWPRLAGIAVTAAGLGLFVSAGGALAAGHMILLGTGMMWAIYALTVRRNAVPALNAAAIVATGSAIIYAPIYLLWLPKDIGAAPLSDVVFQAIFHGVLVGIVAIYAFNRSGELLGPVVGATLPALIPVATLMLGAGFLAEAAGAQEITAAMVVALGLGLILAGQTLVKRAVEAVTAGLARFRRE
jgi:drug/metabolite transporter (DMT)-like permease